MFLYYFFIAWLFWIAGAALIFLVAAIANKDLPRTYDNICFTVGACLLWPFTIPYELVVAHQTKKYHAARKAEIEARLAKEREDERQQLRND